MKLNRVEKIEKYIRQYDTVTNEQLCKEFNISLQTLRRDLKELEENDSIKKVYGGVISNTKSLTNKVDDISFRSTIHAKEKKKMGELASELVENGDVIFIDSGTTVCQIIPYLSHHENVTIVTHSVNVINMASKSPNLKCICIGGLLKPDTLSFAIDLTNRSFSFNKAFVATVGISSDGLTNTDITEGRIKEYIIQQSDETYVLADHSKFEIKGFYHFADLHDLAGIITDQIPNDKMIQICNKYDINIIYE